MTFRVAHWDILHDSLVFLACKGKIFFKVLIASFMYLHLSMQEEDTLEHTNAKCHI